MNDRKLAIPNGVHVNPVFSRGYVKKILVLNDLYDSIHFNHLQGEPVALLYTVLYLLKNVFKNAVIDINDRSGIDYNLLWNNGFNEFNNLIGNERVTKKALSEIELFNYDIVVCYPSLEYELQQTVTNQANLQKHELFTHLKVFSLADSKYKTGIYKPVFTLFTSNGGSSIVDAETIRSIRNFRKNVPAYFKAINKETYEKIYSSLIGRIRLNNEKLLGTEIKKILILDDHYRKFYLGDACFWFLYNTKQTLHSISDRARCRINCCNKNLFPVLAEMFDGSFGENTEFTNSAWDELNFDEYDLILCHPDSVLKLLVYLDTNHPQLLPNTAIYYYNHMIDAKRVIDDYKWNYRILSSWPTIKSGLQNSLTWMNSTDKEIVITDAQRKWADDWFACNGVKATEKVVILIDNASTSNKLLPPAVFLALIKWILSAPDMKVLIFDEKKIGKKEKLPELYGKDSAAKILVAEQLGIRKDMQLLSARCIKGVVGPCTGMLHLANSIYTYFKNKHIVQKRDIPLLLVYTGNINCLNSSYHPNNWWLGSLVKCAIITKEETGCKKVRKLGQCPPSVEEYVQIALPVEEFTSELLIDFIERNSSFFCNQLQGVDMQSLV